MIILCQETESQANRLAEISKQTNGIVNKHAYKQTSDCQTPSTRSKIRTERV